MCGAVFLALTVLVALSPGWSHGPDGWVSRGVVAAVGPHRTVRDVLVGLTWTGHPVVVDVLVLAAAGLLWWRGRVVTASAVVVAGLASLAARELVKVLLDRPRPFPMLSTATGGSFPSGHAAGAAFVGVTLAVLVRRVWASVAGAVYALGVGATRVLLDVHWLTDVVAGLLLGATFALLLPDVQAQIGERLRKETLPDR